MLNINKKVILNLEIALDTYSLLFCVCRSYIANKYKHQLKNEDKALLISQNVKTGVGKILSTLEYSDVFHDESEIIQIFSKNLNTVKPRVPSISFIKHLINHNIDVLYTSSLENHILDRIIHNYESIIKQDMIVYKEGTLESYINKLELRGVKLDKDLIIDNDYNLLLYINGICPSSSLIHINGIVGNNINDILDVPTLTSIKLENYGLPSLPPKEENTVVNLNRPIDNEEINFWDNILPLCNSMYLQGRVVKGFGRGSKLLGVPTANLSMSEENQKLTDNLVPGVYCGIVKLKDYPDKSYISAISIGWNPSFDNPSKTIEAYLIHDFDSDFYGSEMDIVIGYFIRAETDFKSLDHLIEAIRCDIQVSKKSLISNI